MPAHAAGIAPSPRTAGTGLAVSFEIFPPKTEAGTEKLWHAVDRLAVWRPQFVSVTCGAGGAGVEKTFSTVGELRKRSAVEIAPHAAFARLSRARMSEILSAYKSMGISKIIAIRGDPPRDGEAAPPGGTYPDTVNFVSDIKNGFGLTPLVAAYPDVHPLAASPAADVEHLKRKLDAGAARAITQFFFLPETFLRFRDKVRAAGIETTLVPGILPIHNLEQVINFANTCGTIVPGGFTNRFERWGDDAKALFREGVAHAVELCDHLRREGVQEFHFYTLNRSEMTGAVCERLGLRPTAKTGVST